MTWLEPDDEFEGVGAHAENPRYDPVDEGGKTVLIIANYVGDDFPPHNPDFPDVNPATGDERETDPNRELP